MSISRPRHFNEIKSEGGITPEQQATIDANTDKITSNWTINGDDIYYGTGNVGIGTISPEYPLQVDLTYSKVLPKDEGKQNQDIGFNTQTQYWSIWPHASNHSVFTSSTGYNNMNWQGTGTAQRLDEVSIKSAGTIWTRRRYFVSSDTRIKMEIEDVNDTEALDIVNKIPCRKYYYKDPHRQMSPHKTIGFIAQEVKEHLPEAISLETEMIPDELLYIGNPIWNENVLTIENLVFTDKHTGKCTFEVRDGESGIGETIELTVNDDKKSFTFEKHWNYVVLTQKEVNDFHTLDKAKIFALHHAAIQEVDRQLQAEKVKVATLQGTVASQQAIINELLTRVTALENV